MVRAALGGPAADRAVGVEVETTVPTTADLLQVVADDLAHATSPPALDGRAGALLPGGPKTLVLAGAGRAGTVTVIVHGEDGEELDQQQVDLTPDRGATLDLPDDARLLTLVPDGTTVQAAVVAGGRRGVAVLVVREPVDSRLVPDVRPAS